MGRLAPLAALAVASLALAFGCTVKTEGAPCSSDNQCPSGQACGYNRVCSVGAALCRDQYQDLVCSEDRCDPAGTSSQECEVLDAKGICAALKNQATPCDPGMSCGRVGRFADCLRVDFVSPAGGTKVGALGTTVTATLTQQSGRIVPPDAITLMRDTGLGIDFAGTLAWKSGSTSASYEGTYVPAGTIENNSVELTLSVPSQPAILSPTLTVSVDNQAPRITDPLLSCLNGSPCVRDDELTVSATVDDPNLKSVSVSLNLAPAQKVSVGSASGPFSKVLQLKQWPLDAFASDVAVTVTATDDRDNMASLTIPLVGGVTRARPAHDTTTGAAVTSPAVENDGTIVFGVAASTGTDQLRAIKPDAGGTQAWPPVTLEIVSGQGRPLRAAPSIGVVNIFAGSEDGRIYRALLTGALASSTPRAPTSISTTTFPMSSLFTPTTGNVLGVDHAYSATNDPTTPYLYQFYSDETVNTASLGGTVNGSGVLANGALFVVTRSGGGATLRKFLDLASGPTPDGTLALNDGGSLAVPCDDVSVPLAVDGSGATSNVIAVCTNGQVHRVGNVALSDELLLVLPAAPAGSPVVLAADGGILIPTGDGNVRKVVPSGSTGTPWTTSVAASSGEVPTGVAAADDTRGAPAIYVTTSQGRLVALDKDGGEKWRGVLEAGAALGFPTIAPPPPGAPASALPTLYAGSSSGKLFRVVVDSGLDLNAPWPKAHHDIRNTGSNSSQLP